MIRKVQRNQTQMWKAYFEANRKHILMMLLLFVFGGIFGFIYEELFYLIDLGYLVKRGITFGPWIPIYGFGAIVISLTTSYWKKQPWMVFLIAVVVSGLLEFGTGFVLLHIFHTRLWDYNVEIWNWCNIGGFVCLRSVIFFGISALFLQYIVKPLFKWLFVQINEFYITIAAVGLVVIFWLDIVLSLLYRAFTLK
ncbi:MAG: putative ABC transporter permease [Lachnospiraceae bacterium]